MDSRWRQRIHIEPESGWINDPNGLCFFNGNYHVFCQYSPDRADGSTPRRWGHFVSSDDMFSWDYTGDVLRPDIPEDKDGVFSGSAVVSGNLMHIFYTGNVETPDRAAYQIHVTSADGHIMSSKKVILTPADYPEFCSCEVRDPKVWIEEGIWKMVLGAKTTDGRGCVLLYEGSDPDSFRFVKSFDKPGHGYMWECPDMFSIGGHKYLGLSPQGIPSEEFRFQNVHNSGYFRMDGDCLQDFTEYDHGFDLYAPQTFTDGKGNRIIIGWMGAGDAPYTNATTALGWQHCLTLPRILIPDKDGRLRQEPLINDRLCGSVYTVMRGNSLTASGACDIRIPECGKETRIRLGDAVISYSDGILEMDLSCGDVGHGRGRRRIRTGDIRDIRIILDCSGIELYADEGRFVMSSRFYPENAPEIRSDTDDLIITEIKDMEVRRHGRRRSGNDR